MNNPTAVGYLVSQYPTVSHTFILREIRSLRQAGLDIAVASIRRPDQPLEKMTAAEVEEQSRTYYVLGMGILRIMSIQAIVFFRRPFKFLKALWFAWSLSNGSAGKLLKNSAYFAEAVIAGHFFEKSRVALVHTHFSSTVALIVSHLFDLRFSMTVHGSDEFNDVIGFHMAGKVARASFVVTISRYGASQVMLASDPQHWQKVKTIPLGIDPAMFVPQASEPWAAGGATRLLFVGRLAAQKALHLLIGSLAELRERGKDVSLTIVGDGPLRPSMEREITRLGQQDHVFLAGACNFDSVLGFYQNSDIFVLPSFAEGVPVVLMEAMAMEVPCVATWITGIPELITDKVEGLLVPPASVESVVDAICCLIDDREFAGRIARAGREKVLSRYNLDHNSLVLANELRAIAGGRPSGKSPAMSPDD